MADRIIFVFILFLAGVYFYATEKLPSLEIGDPLGPKAFPRLLGVGLLITAGLLLLEILRARKAAAPVVVREEPHARDAGARLLIAGVAVWTLCYFLVFEKLGFVIATSIYLIALTSYLNRGKWMPNVLTSVLFSLAAYLMFTKFLGVNLAPGIMPF
jgi:putative tricarboxylic transport membrane protein